MAVIDTKDLQGTRTDDSVDRGWYTMNVKEVKVWRKTPDSFGKLQVHMMITDAPEQENGGDVLGMNISDFISYEGTDTHKDGGKFAKRYYARFLAAFGIEVGDKYDTDDFTDREVLVLLRPDTDRDGLPSASIVTYKSIDDAPEGPVAKSTGKSTEEDEY